MTKFTKLWRLLMILLISSSVLVVQAQKEVSSDKANAKKEQKKEILGQYNQEQINIIEQSGVAEELFMNGKEPDGDFLIKMQEAAGFDFSSWYESTLYKEDPTDVVGTYTFSQTIGTYTEITGGTLLGSTTSDDQRFVDPAIPLGGTTTTGPGFPIGFNFTFDGIVFDRIAINNNGWVSLGQSLLTPSVNNASTSAYTPIGSTTTITPDDLVSRLVGFGRDLQGQTGSELRIQTIGTTPNQECVIQWKGYKKYGSGGTGDNYNFQIRLIETSNVVKFVYGVVTNGATSGTTQVGLRAAPSATATNWANRTTTTDWSATTAGASNTATCAISSTVYPANGLTFIYTPPAVGTPLPPTNPSPANGATGAAVNGNLTWDFGTNTATYDLWFGPSGSMTQVVTGGTAGTSGSYPYSGINYASPYQWQVIEYNGTLNTPGPIWGFTTTCATYLPPYTEDFTSYLGVAPPPICWQEADAGDPTTGPNTFGTSLWLNDNFANITGSSNCAKVNMYTNTKRDWLITPHFDLSSGSFEVRYDFAVTNWNGTNPIVMGSDDQMMFLISPDGGTTWTTLKTYDASTTYSNTGQTEIVNLSAYNQSDVIFAFWSNEGIVDDAADYDFFIDNFKVQVPPTCPEPSGLTVTNITGISADLGWTENGSATTWDIEFGAAGFTPTGTPTHPDVTSNPFNITGLTATTSYDFYVRAVCGPGNLSVWVGPKNFTTACATFVAPFSEAFQNTTIPNCWTMTGPQAWLFTTTWSDYGAEGVTDHTGTGGSYAGVDGSGSTSISGITLTSPLIDISALTNPALSFFIFNNNIDDASYQTLRVDLWDGAAWNNNVYFWGPTANDPAWVEVIVSLVPYTITGDIQFQFVVDKGPGSPFYDDLIIDDVTVGEGPTCPNPSNLGATNITTTSADLTWTSVSGLSDIEFGIAGFVPTGTPTDAGKTSPYTKGGLAASSSYEFYVRDDCGGGDYSDWVGPYAFDTPCEAATLPYCNNFDLSTFPVCWTQGYAPAVTSDRWNVNTTNLAGGTANEMHAYWQNVIGESWLTTPELVIPAGGAILSFKHFYDDYGTGLTLSVRYSNDNGATWNTGWTLASGGGNAGPETLTIPITVSGNVIIQWYMNGNHFQLDNWYVDDVCLVVPLAHDVSVSSIDMGDYYEPGTVVPKATVYNNGSNTESFNVTMTIGAYTSTKPVTALAPYTSVQVTFDNWNAAVGSYTAQVCTQLGSDLNTANDCQSKPVSVEVLRKIYCYIAYDPSAGLPEGPAWTSVQHPESITSLAATTSDQFISAGTWANGIWYGSEYYDATLLSGGGWWTIDPVNGAMTKIGDYDKGFTGITYNPATGIMYGTYYNSTNANSELYTINIVTGEPTLVGVFTTQLIINLASDGTQFLYGFGLGDDQLYKIDPSVPSAVAVGATGFDFNYGQDMEYDFTNGIMYAAGYYTPDAGATYTGHLMTVNLTTGACTDIGMFQGDSEITGMALPYTFGYKVSGNVYYGATGTTKPMATNTTVTLTPHGTTSTGANGYYELNGVLAGSYTLTGATTKAAGGVQSADALLVQRYLLNALTLTNLQKRCADVNMSNSITVADPLAIKRKVLVPTFNWAAPGYVFDGPFGAPNPVLGGIPINVTTSDVTQELRTLCSGDVNGSYTPPLE